MRNPSTPSSKIPNALSIKYGYNVLFYRLYKSGSIAIRLFRNLVELVRCRSGKEIENLWLRCSLTKCDTPTIDG